MGLAWLVMFDDGDCSDVVGVARNEAEANKIANKINEACGYSEEYGPFAHVASRPRLALKHLYRITVLHLEQWPGHPCRERTEAMWSWDDAAVECKSHATPDGRRYVWGYDHDKVRAVFAEMSRCPDTP
jgi:hypothetical protein